MSSNEARTQLSAADRQILKGICENAGVPTDVVEAMLAEEHAVYGMGRRHGIHERLERLIEDALKVSKGKAARS
jgi:hypothetical protein